MDGEQAGAVGRPLLWAARYLDMKDVIPRRLRLPWEELCLIVAPDRPDVRADVSREIERQTALLREVGAFLFSERVEERLQRTWAFRELEKVVFKVRAEGLPESEVRDRARARYEQLRDEARRRAKTWLPGWSPTEYDPHRTRGAAGVLAVTLLVLDYDDGTPVDAAVAAWDGWPLAMHTTWNYTEEHPRFRLVLPLAEPIPVAAWLAAWTWAMERSGGHIDEACKDPSRLYLLPAIPRPEAPYLALVRDHGGPFLSVPWRDLKPPEPSRPLRTNAPAGRRFNPGRGQEPRDDARRVARVMLRTDRATRERAAAWLEAHVSGRRAERVLCPSCGRLSVWFWIEPGRQATAVCNHRNTCGWWGHLDELLDLRGGAHV